MASALTSPFDVSGALHAPACIEDEPATKIRVEGFADSVAYRTRQLIDRLSEFGEARAVEGMESGQASRDMTAMSRTVRGPGGAVWMISLKPSDAPGFIANISNAHDCLWTYDWGGGRIWVWARDDLQQLHTRFQETAGGIGGHVTLVNGPDTLADLVSIYQPEVAPLAALAKGLRGQFDPREILNPGLMN